MQESLTEAVAEGKLGAVAKFYKQISIDHPRKSDFGDYCCGIALKLANTANSTAYELAELLKLKLEKQLGESVTVEVAVPGFLNFRIKDKLLTQALCKSFTQLHEHESARIRHFTADEFLKKNADEPTGELEESILYSYLRCCSHLSRARSPIYDYEGIAEHEAFLTEARWIEWQSDFRNSAATFDPLFLKEPGDEHEHGIERWMQSKLLVATLIKQIDEFPELFNQSIQTAKKQEANRILSSASHLSLCIERYFTNSIFYSGDEQRMRAKLGLILACKTVLEFSLMLLDDTRKL